MTPEDDSRIRALTQLITKENDKEKIAVLAYELGRLLTLEREPVPVTNDKPKSS